jgi:lipopolysaccharide/colanic/teichoic acid biosynthesis glycosyltransferase
MVVDSATYAPTLAWRSDFGVAIPIGFARRSLDLAVSFFSLVLLSPLLLVVALVVSSSSQGGPFFRQARVGSGGRPFKMLKFRTMRYRSQGSDLTARDDDRVTKVGRVLRLTGVDELPQLWNVLRGHMTLVGPRPETVGLARRYPSECQDIFRFRPGVTGPTQLVSWHAEEAVVDSEMAERDYLETKVPMRVQLDMTYLNDASLGRTLLILARTAKLALGSVERTR